MLLEKDSKVWLKSGMLKVWELLMDTSSQELEDLRVIESLEEL
jgi:hypothetical protein